MKIEQKHWFATKGWESKAGTDSLADANLVLVFGGRHALEKPEIFAEMKSFYPNANFITCSTSGEILDNEVHDDTLILTAVQLEKTTLKFNQVNIADFESSYQAGKNLVEVLKADNLVNIFVLSDGLKVNGSELVKGISGALPENVIVTGGLAGDAARFEKTLVGINEMPSEGKIIAVAFYGDSLKIAHGSKGGWDAFGPTRIVTKSKANVLFELDGQSALAVYKNYLGDKASGLPGTGLLFPLSIKSKEGEQSVVRTLLAVDEQAQSMTFAGDIPEGSIAQLMKANFEKLINGATDAAESTQGMIESGNAELAILVSCVGRKLVLGQRIDEEVESVKDVLGDKTIITGFYSYGEISPLIKNVNCELHNQTMTITTLTEV